MKNLFIVIFVISIIFVYSPLNGQWPLNIIDSNLNGSAFVDIADIDGDDDLDVAATGYLANKVVWYENNGEMPVSWSPHIIDQSNTSPHEIHAADIDDDQDMDLVVAESNTGQVVWFENIDRTGLNWNKLIIDANLVHAAFVTVEDIDGDNDLDVAAAPYEGNRCFWYENSGDTTITWTKHTIDTNIGAFLRFKDMDGDSALDLVTTGWAANEVVWYKNNLPNLNWTKVIIDSNPPGVRQTRVGDIDGDADPDVVITTNNANQVIWYKNTDGTSLNWSKYIIDDNLDRSAGLDLADIDGDTIIDVVASGYDANDVVWYKNNLSDSIWTKNIIDNNLGGASYLTTVDFDSDSDPDVFVVGQTVDDVVWYENLPEVYGLSIEVYPKYLSPLGDTLSVLATVNNPNNHQVEAFAIINANNSAFIDTIQLFDDGLHNDSLANDNIWGGSKWYSGLTEDIYLAKLFTRDIDEGTTHTLLFPTHFTTIGPVVLDHYQITSSDTIVDDGDYLKFEYLLRNDGLTATAINITSKIVPLDTFSTPQNILTPPSYGDIQPGQTVTGNKRQYIRFNHGLDPGIDVHFRIDIFSDESLFWSDTFSVFVYSGLTREDEILPKEFSLRQNYPNPFNPTTTIEFSIPKSEFVTLKIFNLLGQEVTTLVSDKLKPGNYKYTLDGSSLASGIYLYRLQAGDYCKTQKMIVMK